MYVCTQVRMVWEDNRLASVTHCAELSLMIPHTHTTHISQRESRGAYIYTYIPIDVRTYDRHNTAYGA